MSEDRERKPNYNPADYAQLQTDAKGMEKDVLEKYYVKDKDKRHINFGDGLIIFFMVILWLAVLIGIGFAIAEGIIRNKVSDNLEKISEEVCPILGEGYVSSKIINSEYSLNRIICNEFNSNPE